MKLVNPFSKDKRELTREERFGLGVSVAMHMVLFLLFWLMMTAQHEEPRSAFIEVTVGEFATGTQVQQSQVQEEEVATRPDPQPEPVREQEQEPQPEVVERPEEPVKPVDLPDQTEEIISEDVIESPDVEIIDPEAREPEPTEEVRPTESPVEIPDEVVREGSLLSGSLDGDTGRIDAEQGTGDDPDRAAPYSLEWDGEFSRTASVNPRPNYTVEVEAQIRVRITVEPDGSVSDVQPIRRTDPDLEREVIQTLNRWRFNRLPSGVPQVAQTGVVTFVFRLD